jgi:hypothetical protein
LLIAPETEGCNRLSQDWTQAPLWAHVLANRVSLSEPHHPNQTFQRKIVEANELFPLGLRGNHNLCSPCSSRSKGEPARLPIKTDLRGIRVARIFDGCRSARCYRDEYLDGASPFLRIAVHPSYASPHVKAYLISPVVIEEDRLFNATGRIIFVTGGLPKRCVNIRRRPFSPYQLSSQSCHQ